MMNYSLNLKQFRIIQVNHLLSIFIKNIYKANIRLYKFATIIIEFFDNGVTKCGNEVCQMCLY